MPRSSFRRERKNMGFPDDGCEVVRLVCNKEWAKLRCNLVRSVSDLDDQLRAVAIGKPRISLLCLDK
jgi:hypothetical protein